MLRTNHGELLDLFFARLLPSGTGDFDAVPSQLREKQTNPIMLLPYPSTERFFLIERNSHIHGWLGLIEDEDVGTRVFDNFNLPMYTDCKLLVLRSLNFNSPMYTDCKLGRSKRTR